MRGRVITGRKPNIALIGGGMIAQVAHLPFYLADSRCNVVRVAESRPSLLAALRPIVGAERLVENYRAVLTDPGVDAVVLCAPRPAVGPLTLECLQAGKHMFSEKPMAHSLTQAETLVTAARAAGTVYAVGFMKRYDAGIQKARNVFTELMQSKRLGRLLMARFYDYSQSYAYPPPAHTRPAESRRERFAEWPLWPDWLAPALRPQYAWFVNAGSHDVNLLHFFLGERLDPVSTVLSSGGGLIATLRAEGVPVALEIARTAAGVWLEGAEFLFEKGRLSVDVPCPMKIDGVARVRLDDGLQRTQEAIDVDEGWAFARQARGFVDSLIGQTSPLTDGEAGLADLRLSEAIWRQADASHD